MSVKQTQPDPVRITAEKDADRPFIIHPEDDDLFVRTGREVIEACRLNISLELWLKELQGVFDTVIRWSTERRDRVRACFCEPRGSKMVFFFVTGSNRFDFDLADELADLNTRVVNGFNIGMVEMLQIPEAELDRFVNVDTSRPIYGRHPGPHRAVEA